MNIPKAMGNMSSQFICLEKPGFEHELGCWSILDFCQVNKWNLFDSADYFQINLIYLMSFKISNQQPSSEQYTLTLMENFWED